MVLSYEEKRMRLLKDETFKSRFNYFDYKNAWFNVFFFRPVFHLLFILLNQAYPSNFPKWFQTWFEYFGLDEAILFGLTHQGFEHFKSKAKQFLKLQQNVLLQFAFSLQEREDQSHEQEKLRQFLSRGDSKSNGDQNFMRRTAILRM